MKDRCRRFKATFLMNVLAGFLVSFLLTNRVTKTLTTVSISGEVSGAIILGMAVIVTFLLNRAMLA